MSTRRPSGSMASPVKPFGGTLRLPNAPPLPARTPPLPGRTSKPPPGLDGRRSIPPDAGIEVAIVEQPGLTSFEGESWTLFEIWTRNRVYHLNVNFECVAVISRSTGREEPTHPLKGARLTGGERRNKSAHLVDIYFPLPSPGTEAVFKGDAKRNGHFAKTSTIERVVLRVRRVRIASVADSQVWEERLGKGKR